MTAHTRIHPSATSFARSKRRMHITTASLVFVASMCVGLASGPAQADISESAGGWNDNAAGRLSLGGNHSCAILNNGSLKCWGQNSKGELGIDSTTNVGDATGQAMPPTTVNLGAGRTAKAVATGGQHTCAILDTGDVKCWGDNTDAQLGYGASDATPKGDAPGEMAALGTVNLGAGRTAKSIAAAGNITCVILDNDTVKCWGKNNSGQAGQNSTANPWGTTTHMNTMSPVDLGPAVGTKYTAKRIAVGTGNVCVILNNDKVKCWGAGGGGANGLDSTASIGDSSVDEPGNTAPIDLGTGRTAKAVTVGNGFVCAVLDNGTLKCWGLNVTGGTGQDVTVSNLVPGTTGIGDGVGPSVASINPVNLGAGRTVTSVTAENERVCASLDDGSVKCWGNNSAKQNGYGTAVTDRYIGGGYASPGFTKMTDIPFLDFGGAKVQYISIGSAHNCAVMYDATIRCWGSSALALGYNSADTIGTDTGRALSTAASVNLGDLVGTASTTTTTIATTTTTTGGGGSSGSSAAPIPLENGALPNLSPGETSFTVGGVNASVKLSTSGGRITASAGSFSVTFGASSSGQAVSLGTGKTLAVPQGSTVSVTGKGFKAGTTARLWVLKGSKQLGAARVSANGTVTLTAKLLSSLSAGDYTMQVSGTGADGKVRAVSLGFSVKASTTTPGELPATGSHGVPTTALALMATLLGIVMMRRKLRSA